MSPGPRIYFYAGGARLVAAVAVAIVLVTTSGMVVRTRAGTYILEAVTAQRGPPRDLVEKQEIVQGCG